MNMKHKINMVYNWLNAGYAVYENGKRYAAIWKNGKYFQWCNYGSSANDATKKGLQWILTKVFKSDTNFYIINNDGKMECTDPVIAEKANTIECTFTFFSRNIITFNETKLFETKSTLAAMLQDMHNIAEKYSRENPDSNIVHYTVTCQRGMFDDFRYWQFAI